MKIWLAMLVMPLLASCSNLKGISEGDPNAVVDAPFELADNVVDTAFSALYFEKPRWKREHERRLQERQDNIEREQALAVALNEAEQRVASLRIRVDALVRDGRRLEQRNRVITRLVENNAYRLADQEAEISALRQEKSELLGRIADAEDELERAQLDSTIGYYLQRRKAEGAVDPVEEQLQRLRGVSESLEYVLP